MPKGESHQERENRLGYLICRECGEPAAGATAVCLRHMRQILWEFYDQQIASGYTPSEALKAKVELEREMTT